MADFLRSNRTVGIHGDDKIALFTAVAGESSADDDVGTVKGLLVYGERLNQRASSVVLP